MDIMSLLKDLSRNGRTVILVTHAMDNVGYCDNVVFLGKGGRLCYYGLPDEILAYFGTENIAEVFKLLSIEANVTAYREKFDGSDVKLV
jgi:ABC-type multidrug transport system ATPase subunit